MLLCQKASFTVLVPFCLCYEMKHILGRGLEGDGATDESEVSTKMVPNEKGDTSFDPDNMNEFEPSIKVAKCYVISC